MKNPDFEYRTSFVTKKLKNGDISLRISNVRLSDAGRYKCTRLMKNYRETSAVTLVVGAVSEPKLSVVSAESGGVTLQCEASCWLPEPEIKLLDDRGNEIPGEDPKRDQDARGCYTVRRRVTLRTATSRVTCRVHQVDFNQSRETDILIPADCMRSSFRLILGISVGGVILFACAFAFAVYLWKRCGKSAEAQKQPVTRQPSDESTVSGTCENQLLLQHRETSSTVEQLTKKVADLRAELRDKDETIRQLQNSPRSQPSQHNQPAIDCSPSRSPLEASKPFSPQSSILTSDRNSTPAVSSNSDLARSANLPQNKPPKPGIQGQNSNPGPSRPIQKHHLNNSSLAVFSDNDWVLYSSSSEKKQGHIGRSRSVSHALRNPQNAKCQRRYSLGSQLSNNRYVVLADLNEESEQLVS
ncbi:butyrophilin subfamily 3 member A2-like isoform X2 [Xiphias gladius]|nr:butyrophilin subfamily 3 member A2-like isoform X2 [Xiphias gladius]XP_039996725.1 butyrophilin subfamily 3 member A2-like isoform X2 [Xiphias gladius]